MRHPSSGAARLSRNRFVLVDVRRSPQAAKNFMDEFDRQIDLFCSPPDVFALSCLSKLAAKGYRSLFVNNYIVLVALDGDIVRVAHIFIRRRIMRIWYKRCAICASSSCSICCYGIGLLGVVIYGYCNDAPVVAGLVSKFRALWDKPMS